MEVEVLEAGDVVVLEVFLEVLLEDFVLIFHGLDFEFEAQDLCFELLVVVLELFDPGGLEEDVLVFF